MNKCKECGGGLFPWERNSDTCGGCVLADNHKIAHQFVLGRVNDGN